MVRKPLLPAILGFLIVFSWQALTVHFNYQHNWSALFFIGDRYSLPSELAGERIWIFHNNPGCDATFYHLVAHDPWLQRGFFRQI